MAQYDKLINLGLLSQFLTKAKTIFAPKITASGILKGDGAGNVSAATAGTDYATPALVKVSDTQPTESENKLWVDTDGGSGNSYQIPTVAEMQAADNSILGNLAMIESSPATQAHAVGDYIVYNGQLYKVTAAISAGESLTIGTNVEATNIATAFGEVQQFTGTYSVPLEANTYSDCKVIVIGKLVIVNGFFCPANTIPANTDFATLPIQFNLDTYATVLSSNGNATRMQMYNRNKIRVEFQTPGNQYYSYTLVSFI